MKKSLIELQQESENILRSMQDLQRQGVASVTDERWVKAAEEMKSIDEAIELAKQAEAIEKRLLQAQADNEQREREKKPSKEENQMTFDSVFKRFLTMPQHGQLSQDERRLLETRGTNTQISSTNSLGGYIVPQSFSNELEAAGIWKGGMFEACRIYLDTIGGTLKWPTADDTGTNGEIVGQGVARTVADITFGNLLFTDYTIDSNIVKVSRELINDERVQFLQEVLAMMIAERINRKANSVLTNGTGTNEPYGLTVAGTGTGITTAAATAITKPELTRFMYTVDKWYTNSAKVGWMMHRNTLGYLRTLDFSTDTTHLFADLKVAGEPDMLLNYPVYINNDLPDLSGGLPIASTKHIWFGDFSKYVIRRIEGVAIERNDSVYWDKFTAGFMGWTRLDGNLINTAAIKPLLQHA